MMMQEITVGAVFGLAIKLYALMTPTAVLSAFITHTRGRKRIEQYGIACKTALAIFIIGEMLLLFGSRLFGVFGFTLDAFRIGVGILLFLAAIDLMNDEYSPDAALKNSGDISVVPLAIPLGMGPASIGTVMIMGAQAKDNVDLLIGSACLFLAAAGMALLLCLAGPAQRMLGRTGLAVMAKLTGLLISAMAAQVIFTGIRAFMVKVAG